MDSGFRESGTRGQVDPIPADSLIGRMTAEAQAARDAFGYGTVAVDGKVYVMRENWVQVCDRAAAKFGGKAAADEALRFARAKGRGK